MTEVLQSLISTVYFWEDETIAIGLVDGLFKEKEIIITSVEVYLEGIRVNTLIPTKIGEGCYALKKESKILDWNDYFLQNKVLHAINQGTAKELLRKLYS